MKKQTRQTNQVYLYSVSTKAFYNELEEAKQQEIYSLEEGKEKDVAEVELKQLMTEHEGMRTLNPFALHPNKVVAQFESNFTRALGLESNSNIPTTDFMIVQGFHYVIMDNLIENGFTLNGEHYRYLFSSAGQIRTKKLVFVNEIKYKAIENKLTAGLSDEIINTKGGISINKLIAYKGLVNSSSIKWDIDLNKAIVVDDFEFTIKDREVDYIGSDYEVIRKNADIVNKVMDGAGIALPSVIDTNIQFRGIWFKGLLSPFPYDKFINETNANPVVKDVWGKEWNIIEDDIQIIFTKSQFKMAKYFESWEQYKENVRKYDCEFSICDIEGDVFEDKKLNYQMIQTLYRMPQSDLEELASYTKETIETATESTENMLEFIGATKDKKYKQPWQEALLLYPELINDPYFKEMVKDKKAALIKEARSGKILIPDTKRTFLIPDYYAFCQWLFGLEVTGLLVDGEVSCKLYEDEKELDVLRSPHLYIEHAVRINVVNSDIEKWFMTNGMFTSIWDAISTQLMFDNDGDTALIVSNPTFVKNAKEHMEGVVPLQYEMGQAKAQEVNSISIIKSLKSAFSMNIGEISNTISKIFAQDVITEEDLTLVKQLTYQNNMSIDYAKTLFFAKPPKSIKNKINNLKSNKLPAFFVQAKDKKEKQVLERNQSTVNRLYDVMQTKRLSFNNKAYDFTTMLNDPNAVIDEAIVTKYKEVTETRYLKLQQQLEIQGDAPTKLFAIHVVREELLNLNSDAFYVADVLVKHLHQTKSKYKKFLWDCFGSEVLWNMKKNLGKLKECECGTEFEPASNRQSKCNPCKDEAKKEATRLRVKKHREKTA